jgi:transcriptional regulator with XRE-family HTH domain
MDKTIHQRRNIKRFREMLGIKQEGLAYELGDDWNQKKISLLEQKEVVEEALLEQVAKVLKVNTEAIKSFNEEAAISNINTFYDHSAFNFQCTINPIENGWKHWMRTRSCMKDYSKLKGKKFLYWRRF